MARINPENKVVIGDKSLLGIDITSYKGSSVYGAIGTNATGKSTDLISKLNHRTIYDPNNELGAGTSVDHPYFYEKEVADGQGGDWDSDQFIDTVSSGFNSNLYRKQIEIGAAITDDGTRSLNGDTNRDTIHTSGTTTGNEYRYNAGNFDYELREYDDNDLQSLDGKLYQYSDGSIESESGKVEGGADVYNTSNTMLKTMNAYSVTVKPMDARDL